MSEWISVKDRLPDVTEYFIEYIVFDSVNKKVLPDYWNPNGFWTLYSDWVTHWMPMPAPPES